MALSCIVSDIIKGQTMACFR